MKAAVPDFRTVSTCDAAFWKQTAETVRCCGVRSVPVLMGEMMPGAPGTRVSGVLPRICNTF
jgi:hypothetical protein